MSETSVNLKEALTKSNLTLEAFIHFSKQSTSIRESVRFKLGISQVEFNALVEEAEKQTNTKPQ